MTMHSSRGRLICILSEGNINCTGHLFEDSHWILVHLCSPTPQPLVHILKEAKSLSSLIAADSLGSPLVSTDHLVRWKDPKLFSTRQATPLPCGCGCVRNQGLQETASSQCCLDFCHSSWLLQRASWQDGWRWCRRPRRAESWLGSEWTEEPERG